MLGFTAADFHFPESCGLSDFNPSVLGYEYNEAVREMSREVYIHLYSFTLDYIVLLVSYPYS